MAAASGVAIRNARTKILFVLDEFPGPYAGTESQFWLLLQGLDRRIFEPAIMLLRSSAYLDQHARDIPLHVLHVPRLKTLSGLARIARASFWARRNGYKLAHIFLNDSTLAFPLPLQLTGCKVIVSRRDLGFWYTSVNLPILRFQARFVDAVVSNCAAVKEAVVRSEGFAPKQVHVIYNGLARESGVVAALSRSTLGISPQANVVVVVANLRPLKRIADIVRALPALSQRSSCPTHLLVVGEDRAGESGSSHRSELESLGRELGVADRLHFLGRMDDPMPAISIADVGVLSSDTEGLSNVVIEYMSAAKPVVATRVGGNAELVCEGVTGYLVEPRDVPALTGALEQILNDRDLAVRLGLAGRERANENFTAKAMIARHEELYRCLVATSS